jgi:hypothetical protein
MELEEPIESLYFNWLCAKVMRVDVPTPSLTYWKLLRELQNTEFVWKIPMDDNRAEDGKELRNEFLLEARIQTDEEWFHIGCSILEMFIAFSKRAAFITDRSPQEWFWEFIGNLGLASFNDAGFNLFILTDILYTFIWRTYDYHGNGGMFPIRHPRRDQREVEIWYQFCDYLEEQEDL